MKKTLIEKEVDKLNLCNKTLQEVLEIRNSCPDGNKRQVIQRIISNRMYKK